MLLFEAYGAQMAKMPTIAAGEIKVAPAQLTTEKVAQLSDSAIKCIAASGQDTSKTNKVGITALANGNSIVNLYDKKGDQPFAAAIIDKDGKATPMPSPHMNVEKVFDVKPVTPQESISYGAQSAAPIQLPVAKVILIGPSGTYHGQGVSYNTVRLLLPSSDVNPIDKGQVLTKSSTAASPINSLATLNETIKKANKTGASIEGIPVIPISANDPVVQRMFKPVLNDKLKLAYNEGDVVHTVKYLFGQDEVVPRPSPDGTETLYMPKNTTGNNPTDQVPRTKVDEGLPKEITAVANASVYVNKEKNPLHGEASRFTPNQSVLETTTGQKVKDAVVPAGPGQQIGLSDETKGTTTFTTLGGGDHVVSTNTRNIKGQHSDDHGFRPESKEADIEKIDFSFSDFQKSVNDYNKAHPDKPISIELIVDKTDSNLPGLKTLESSSIKVNVSVSVTAFVDNMVFQLVTLEPAPHPPTAFNY